MIYINALELINVCVENEILQEVNGGVPVYRKATPTHKEGWYLTDKDLLAKELMQDTTGQNILITELKRKGVEFTPTDYSWMNRTIDKIDDIIK